MDLPVPDRLSRTHSSSSGTPAVLKSNGRGVLILNSRGSIVPFGIYAQGVEVAAQRSRCQLSNKVPKLVHSRCMCDSRPDIVSCRNRIVDDGTEPSSDNVSVLIA